jgi:hypothetical protein
VEHTGPGETAFYDLAAAALPSGLEYTAIGEATDQSYVSIFEHSLVASHFNVADASHLGPCIWPGRMVFGKNSKTGTSTTSAREHWTMAPKQTLPDSGARRDGTPCARPPKFVTKEVHSWRVARR